MTKASESGDPKPSTQSGSEKPAEGGAGQGTMNAEHSDQPLIGNVSDTASSVQHLLQDRPAQVEISLTKDQRQLLCAIAKVNLRLWRIPEAMELCRLAGADPPRQDLIYCGNAAMYDCQYDTAFGAYQAAGANDELVRLGDAAFLLRRPGIALKAWTAAGTPIPKDKLIACGDYALAQNNLSTAFDAYQAAGANDRLVRLGDAACESGSVVLALKAWTAAGTRIQENKLLNACANLVRADLGAQLPH